MTEYLASNLRNKQVTHQSGVDIGTLKDVDFDAERGTIEALIVTPHNLSQVRRLDGVSIVDGEVRVPARLVSNDGVNERIVVRQ